MGGTPLRRGSRAKALTMGSARRPGKCHPIQPVKVAVLYGKMYITAMRTKSYSELRRTLAATLDSVNDDHAPVLITRDRGKPAAVLMSLEDYASYEETAYLLSSPAYAKTLLDGIAELDAGGGVRVTMDELVAMSRETAATPRRKRRSAA